MSDPTAIAQGIAVNPLAWTVLGLAIAIMYLFKAYQVMKEQHDKTSDAMRDQLITIVREVADKSVQSIGQVNAIVSRLEDVIDFVESSRRNPTPVPYMRRSSGVRDDGPLDDVEHERSTPPIYSGSGRRTR